MRIAVLADLHANLPALEAVLAAARREGVDRWAVAGDLVGYGAQPNECVGAVAALDAIAVAGNHDLIALGRLSDAQCIPLARHSLAWTREVLTADARAFLEALPLRAAAPGLVVAHGSLDDPETYVARRAAAAAELARVAAGTLLVLGHTHRPLAFSLRGSTFLNPGAVGQSRELRLRARYAVADLERGTVELRAVPYDVEAARRALAVAGLADAALHLRPSVPRALARAVRSRI